MKTPAITNDVPDLFSASENGQFRRFAKKLKKAHSNSIRVGNSGKIFKKWLKSWIKWDDRFLDLECRKMDARFS